MEKLTKAEQYRDIARERGNPLECGHCGRKAERNPVTDTFECPRCGAILE